MQATMTISKQKQAIDQTFSNTIMLNTLAALENLAKYYGYKRAQIFDYYSGDAKNEKQLINAVYLQLNIFRASHLNYQKIYPEYNFPHNLSYEQIINIINKWEEIIVDENIRKLYEEFKNYISGHSEISGINKEIKELGKNPITQKDLHLLSYSTPYVNHDMFSTINKIISYFQSKNGKEYKFEAILNGKKENNQVMIKLRNVEKSIQKNIENTANSLKEVDNQLEKMFKVIYNKNKIPQSEKMRLQYLIVHFYEQFIEIKERINVSKYKDQYNALKNQIIELQFENEDLHYMIMKIDEIINCLDGIEPLSKFT